MTKAQCPEAGESLRQLLHDWIRLNVGASYSKLSNELDVVNHKVVAEEVRNPSCPRWIKADSDWDIPVMECSSLAAK